jgi:hypothetical protein
MEAGGVAGLTGAFVWVNPGVVCVKVMAANAARREDAGNTKDDWRVGEVTSVGTGAFQILRSVVKLSSGVEGFEASSDASS